jgi:two-component system phosphate regulon sensor histidine kinase PhoR
LAATNLERPPFRLGSLVGNLAEARWILVALAALLAALAIAGLISPFAAFAVFAGVALLVALIPVNRPASEPAIPVRESGGEELEALLGQIVEALPDASFALDRRGVVRALNRRALAALSLRLGDSLTFRLRVPDVLAAFDRVSKGGPPERVEFLDRVPAERLYAAWLARLDMPAGRGGGFTLLILDDLTERMRMERVRVDFVANASHELRTPLASLAGFIETLQGPARNDAAARERFLSIMHDQAERMSRLVNDLLSLSRVEMKAHVRPTEHVELKSVVSHVVDALEPLARELGVAIETHLPDEPVELVGDRDELVQVFENLVENACKYGQSGKRVAVTVAAPTPEHGATVTVRDFGPGIAEEHVPRLTERFYRIDVDVSRRHRGTGLGLAIVKHILARHQARMTVDSKLGAGAEFTVTFPQIAATEN